MAEEDCDLPLYQFPAVLFGTHHFPPKPAHIEIVHVLGCILTAILFIRTIGAVVCAITKVTVTHAKLKDGSTIITLKLVIVTSWRRNGRPLAIYTCE